MKHSEIIIALERDKLVFDSLLRDVSEEVIQWKPNPNKWSLLEIVCHLLDEEVDAYLGDQKLLVTSAE